MKPKLFIFVLGLIVGLLLALVAPPVLEDLLPESMGREQSATTGKVVAKRLQEDRLLLTIETGEGAVLATFQQKVDEIHLLVDRGDRLTLGITAYEPFVTDPRILGVKKGPESVTSPFDVDLGVDEDGEDGEGGADGGADAGAREDGEAVESGAEEQEEPVLPPVGPPLEDQDEPDEEPPVPGRR